MNNHNPGASLLRRVMSPSRWLFAAMIAGCSASTAISQAPVRSGNGYLDVLRQHDVQGTVMVARDGVTRFTGERGMADLASGRLNTAATRFRLGSVTKQFTAMAIMLLQDRGQLRTSDTVGRFLPDAPAAWQPLTLHQLLSHTAGLIHTWSVPAFAQQMAEPVTLDEALARFHELPLLHPPGTKWSYSGVGYLLLAKIIENVSGSTYGEFLELEIFEPLGMGGSGAEDPQHKSPAEATPYLVNVDGSLTIAPPLHLPAITGGGNLYSTIDDMGRWGEALRQRQLLSAAGYDELYRPVMNGFAYGWINGSIDGTAMLWHSGGTPGTNTYVMQVPSVGVWVVVLANKEPTRVGAIAAALARVAIQESTR